MALRVVDDVEPHAAIGDRDDPALRIAPERGRARLDHAGCSAPEERHGVSGREHVGKEERLLHRLPAAEPKLLPAELQADLTLGNPLVCDGCDELQRVLLEPPRRKLRQVAKKVLRIIPRIGQECRALVP